VRDQLLLHLNGHPIRVTGNDAFLTLSDFLRRRRGLTGTKVVCAEGDCGSCSVLVGRPEAGRLRYAAVTSCIQLMFQLDATHVVTVEGLRQGRELNPIQEAMVACHGTQCGFCTPGFVVALYDLMHEGRPIDAEAVRRGLVGNLCRCTGYDSIVRSALATGRGNLRPIDALYPPDALLAELPRAAGEEVRIDAGHRKFYKPTAIQRAARFRGDNPGCVVIAGGTDMGVVYNKRMRAIDVALSTGGLSDLRAIRVDAGALYVGACATLTALERAALEHLPELGRFLAWFGSPLIKNAGTLGGNLVTGSPIGDTIPALMVLGAQIELAGLAGSRRVPIDQFYTGYRKTVLGPDELVTGVQIPLLRPGETFKLYKVSRRKDLDISSFGAAIWLRRSGSVIEDIRIAYGGVGPMVMRMSNAEAVLRGQPAALDRFEHAGDVARAEVTPITDVRGSEQYRRALAANILVKFWHDAFAGEDQRRDGNGDGRGPQAPPPAPRVRRPRLAPGRKGRT
jgi:xanthine dehydrogenase small subunit